MEPQAMRNRALLVRAALCLSLSGCAVADLVFCAFSNAYTGGGYSDTERRAHFDQQWEMGREAARREGYR